jgi:hypothetical protein
MHPWGPPVACGYRRRKRNTTLEEHWPTTYRHTNVTGETTHVATNLKSYFTNNTHKDDKDSLGNKQGHGRHQYQYASARDCHSCRGSHWVDSESTWRFCVQSAQFDTSTKAFHVRSHPTALEIMSKIHKDNRNTQLCNNHLQLAALAYQIAQHEQIAVSKIRKQVEEFWHKPAYGKTLRAKPDDCV